MVESSLTDLELLEIEVDALLTHDARGRIVAANEPEGDPAPRFSFWRTRMGNIWRVSHVVPEDIAQELEALAAAEPVHDDLDAPPVHFQAMAKALGVALDPGEPERELSYLFPAEIPEPVGVTRITRATIPLLSRIVPYLEGVEQYFEQGEPCMTMVVDGSAVSLCYSCRLTDRAAEAGLDTLEGYRGRGYAPAVTAAWARAVRESGRIPFYSTSLDNVASQAVARKLGLVQYAASLGFE